MCKIMCTEIWKSRNQIHFVKTPINVECNVVYRKRFSFHNQNIFIQSSKNSLILFDFIFKQH